MSYKCRKFLWSLLRHYCWQNSRAYFCQSLKNWMGFSHLTLGKKFLGLIGNLPERSKWNPFKNIHVWCVHKPSLIVTEMICNLCVVLWRYCLNVSEFHLIGYPVKHKHFVFYLVFNFCILHLAFTDLQFVCYWVLIKRYN